jgi:hypothetical protein
MYLSKKAFDKYLVKDTYDFICLNDGPDISNNDFNLHEKICDIITGDLDCYEKNKKAALENNFIHIKIPQEIHNDDYNRPNHGGPRHIENLNWFNQNFTTLVPDYKKYDFICHIDSDAFLSKPIDLGKELNGYDMAGPFIYLNPNLYYIHTGLFFINIKTVVNMKDITWDNTLDTDTGSNIAYFIMNNPHYKIKKLGHYDGYSINNGIENGHTIISLDIQNIQDNFFKLIDVWFDFHFYHFRAGSCFGPGSLQNRTNDRLFLYNKKYNFFKKNILHLE